MEFRINFVSINKLRIEGILDVYPKQLENLTRAFNRTIIKII